MAGGSVSTYPTPPKSSSSTLKEDGLLNLKFGTYDPNSHKSEASNSNDLKNLSNSAAPSTDPFLRAANLQNAPTTDSLLERKCQDPRSEEVKFIEGCPVVSFDIGDKAQLISKVKFVIVAKFSHGRPIFRDFQAFLSSLKFRGQFVVSAFDRKHVFIEFAAFEDFVKLWMMKSCVVKGFKVRFFRWTDSFSPSVEISIAPVWVSLPGLPLYFLEEKALISITSVLGKPLYIDPLNLTHQKVGAAWICVALDVAKPLPEAIWLQFMGDGKVLEQFLQRIVYYDLPTFCKGCYHLGHVIEDCKMRYGGRSNAGFGSGRHDEIGILDNQIPVAVVLQDRKWTARDQYLEEGEIEEVTVGEEIHMNEAKHPSVVDDARIELEPATDTVHKEGNSLTYGEGYHNLAADVNHSTTLEGINNSVSTDGCKIGFKNGRNRRDEPLTNAVPEAVSQVPISAALRKEPMSETDALNTLHHFVKCCVSGDNTHGNGFAVKGEGEATALSIEKSKDGLVDRVKSSLGEKAVINRKQIGECSGPVVLQFLIDPDTPDQALHQSKQAIGGERPLSSDKETVGAVIHQVLEQHKHVDSDTTHNINGADVPSFSHTASVSPQLNKIKNNQQKANTYTPGPRVPSGATNPTPLMPPKSGALLANDNVAPPIKENKEKQKFCSPSWSDSVGKNLPMDYSIPPFPNTAPDEESDTSSEEEEAQSSDEERNLKQLLDKFEKASQELSSTKNTRIICKKHILPGMEKRSYSEEEEAERVPEDFNLDPLMTRNGEFVRLSKLTESRAKLIRQRSVSPFGRPSTKLKNLQTKLGSIDLEDNCAILMSTDKYEKTQEIKVTRRSNQTKEVCNTPKRRGRPRSRRNSPPNAQEPRKRGRPKKRM